MTDGGWLGAQRTRSRPTEDLLEGLCRTCVREAGVDGACLSIVTGDGSPEPVHATDELSERLGDLQFTLGEGPCVDASRTGRPVLVPDLAATSPGIWPQFGAGADAAGLRAVFALPLQVGGIRLGVLDLYRHTAGALSREQLAGALSFAGAATQLLLDLQAQDTALGIPPPHALAVLDDRAEVHQATGVVSVRAGVSLAQALALLRARAYAEDRPIGDLARDVLDGLVQIEENDDHD